MIENQTTSYPPVSAQKKILQTSRILVVDNDKSIRSMIAATLQKQGHQVLAAANGLEALEIIGMQSDRIDLILLDLDLPKIDGLDVIKSLRRESEYPLVPVAVLTSAGDPKDIRACIRQGVLH